MEEKKRIYLHIGMPKTGTSSLQFFCQENQDILGEKGYFYPVMPFRYRQMSQVRNAHFLVGSVYTESGEVDEAKTGEYRDQAFDLLEGYLNKYSNIILSDEAIWNCLTERNRDALDIIKQFCDKQSVELKVIVYLRRQDSFLESYWKQKIRRRGATWKWRGVMRHTPSYIALDYYPHLCNIAETVGKENLIVRRYQKGKFLGTDGTIFSDFLNAVGLELTEEYKPLEKQANVSLNNNFAEIKRIMNYLLSEDQAARDREQIWLERIALECSRYEKEQYESSMFSEKEQQKFMEQYKASNAKVAQEFMGEEELFLGGAPSLPKWTRDNAQQYEDTLLFLGKALLEQKQEIGELKRELRSLRNQPGISQRIYHKLKRCR